MMDSTMTNRPQLTWVEVPTADGGSRLEMRWDVPGPRGRRHDPRRLTQRGTPGPHPDRGVGQVTFLCPILMEQNGP